MLGVFEFVSFRKWKMGVVICRLFSRVSWRAGSVWGFYDLIFFFFLLVATFRLVDFGGWFYVSSRSF